jgi:ATP-dependent helicase/nuclease subunit A
MTPSETKSSRLWTDSQREGIETVGCSLLVSAAAGSGKTAVLAERCAHLVCDGKPPCNVDQILVVTFTESAAAEMKGRIQKALRSRIQQRPGDERLARQAALVEHAHVSTVHGFCTRLLRRHFNRVGLDPNFQIIDADEAALLRGEVAEDLLHRRYEQEHADDFHRLIDCYAGGDDARLMERVVATHQLLQSLADPQGWMDRVLRELREAAEQNLETSKLGRDFIQHVDRTLCQLVRQCKDGAASIRKMDRGLAAYAEQLDEFQAAVAHWLGVLRKAGLDLLVSEVRDFTQFIPQAPKVAGATPGKDVAKNLLDAVKKVVREGTLAELLIFDSRAWQRGMEEILPHAQTFLSLVNEFGAAYSDAKASARALDFSDLERFALEILGDGNGGPSNVAKSLQEQYRHVLVDEYQDINEIQDAILRLVSRESHVGLPARDWNLFCVGDVKQSIFRFRLADPQRFLDRQSRFSKKREGGAGRVIELRENFRSRGPLLEAINSVFEKLMTVESSQIDYVKSHRLRAGRVYPEAKDVSCFVGAPIELHLLPRKFENPAEEDADVERAEYEAMLVARRIQEMMGINGGKRMHVVNGEGNQPEPIEYGDMVILLRAMQFKADTFADVLRAHKIPVHSEGGAGFFEATEVRDVLSLLRVLDNQQQDIPLAAVLRSPLAGIPQPDDALARIRLAYRGQEEEIPFHEAVRRYAVEQDDELAAQLRDFLNKLADWRDQANKRPIAELLWRLYEQTGYLAYCSGLEDGNQRVANLVDFHERAGQFGGFLRQGLHRFLQFIEGLREQRELSRPSIAGDAKNVVRIMSVHRAKGLEFPVVFLPDLGKRHNLQDTVGSILADRTAGLGMEVVDQQRLIRYASVSSILVRDSLLRQTLAEELRLLYVAMTRAREHLILIGTSGAEDLQRWEMQWKQHAGAMPADAVLGGRSVLEWLGPVAAMTGSSVFRVERHDESEIRQWTNPRLRRAAFSDLQQRLANLDILDAPAGRNELAERITRRFDARYEYSKFTGLSATVSVSSLAKSSEDVLDNAPEPLQRKLDLPRFFAESATPKATDIGTATHLILQHWDFSSRATNGGEIGRQINLLIDRKLISPTDAKLVDREAIEWFLNSEVGLLLRNNHAQLLREIPFAIATESDASAKVKDGMDRIMVRGRIDLLLPTETGMAVVDYKTDNVSAQTLTQRSDRYRGQMQFYREAVETIGRKVVTDVYLIFLKPRIIKKL